MTFGTFAYIGVNGRGGDVIQNIQIGRPESENCGVFPDLETFQRNMNNTLFQRPTSQPHGRRSILAWLSWVMNSVPVQTGLPWSRAFVPGEV